MRKRGLKTIIRMAASACCVCLVALTGFGVWRSGMLTVLPEQTEAGALNSALPTSDCVFLDEYDEKSIINNVEVAIGQDTNSEYYFAEFLLHNVGFRFIVEGLTQDEFVAVISSLIQ